MDQHRIETLEEIINDAFLKDALVKIVKPLVDTFVKKNKKAILKKGFSKELISLEFDKKKMPVKAILVNYCLIPFYSKKLFNLFRESMPEHLRIILDELVWVERLNTKEVLDLTGIHIYTEDSKRSYYSRYKIKEEYNFFKNNKNSYRHNSTDFILYISSEFREYLKPFYDIPDKGIIKPLEVIDETEFVYKGEENILFDLSRLIAYKKQGQIKTTKTNKTTASTLRKMNKNLGLKEFYPAGSGNQIELIRTQLLAGLIIDSNIDIAEKTNKNLKNLIQETYLEQFDTLNRILHYLKGTKNIYYYKNPKEQTFLTLVNKFPSEQWLSMDNIENYIKYSELNFDIIDKTKAGNIHITYKSEYGNEKLYINYSNYNNVISKATLKGSIFLFAAYGLLDIAYNLPEGNEKTDDFPNLYGGLKYIRLNKLGSYVLEKIKTYEVPEHFSKSSIELSTDTLTITIDPKDTIAPISLAPFTIKVSPNRFNTDFSIFLKGVKNKQDLENKIKLFITSVNIEIPENWNAFFEELKQKINPLNLIEDTLIFQIPSDNKELLRLIAQDQKIRHLCIKAEDYQVLVPNKNLRKFKARLEEFGYLL